MSEKFDSLSLKWYSHHFAGTLVEIRSYGVSLHLVDIGTGSGPAPAGANPLPDR